MFRGLDSLRKDIIAMIKKAGARLELLHAIRINKPRSIQELSKIVERDFKNVYQDVKLLAEYGLIELKEAGPRKASTPKANFSELVLAA